MENKIQTIEVKPSFPVARKANERETIKDVPAFRIYAKERNIDFANPVALKAARKEHEVETIRVRKLMSAAGAMLVASTDFRGKKVQTWTDSKGMRQVQVNLIESAEPVTAEEKEKVIGALSVEELQKALDAAKAAATPVTEVESETETEAIEA